MNRQGPSGADLLWPESHQRGTGKGGPGEEGAISVATW